MAGEKPEIPGSVEAARRRKLSENQKAEARVHAMVMAFDQMMVGQNNVDCIMAMYTLVANWIYHKRPEPLTEEMGLEMVIRGIKGTLSQMHKEGIKPGEPPDDGRIEFKN